MASSSLQSGNLDPRIHHTIDDETGSSLIAKLELAKRLFDEPSLMSRVSYREKIEDLNIADIKARGDTLIIDNTGTLYTEGADYMTATVVNTLREIAQANIRLCILPKGNAYSPLFQQLGISVIRDAAPKPEPAAFTRAAQLMKTKEKQCHIVGDRLLEDGGGLPLGMSLTLVNPLSGSQGIFDKLMNQKYLHWLETREFRRQRQRDRERK